MEWCSPDASSLLLVAISLWLGVVVWFYFLDFVFIKVICCGCCAFGFMVLAVLVDILICLLQGGEVSELEQRVEQWCILFPSLGEGSGCMSSFLLRVNKISVVCLSIILSVDEPK
jgi:hypothetical protein